MVPVVGSVRGVDEIDFSDQRLDELAARIRCPVDAHHVAHTANIPIAKGMARVRTLAMSDHRSRLGGQLVTARAGQKAHGPIIDLSGRRTSEAGHRRCIDQPPGLDREVPHRPQPPTAVELRHVVEEQLVQRLIAASRANTAPGAGCGHAGHGRDETRTGDGEPEVGGGLNA